MALFLLLCSGGTLACAQQQKQDTIVVSRDGTGKYRDIQEAVEAVRAFMDYTVTIFKEWYIQRKTGDSFMGEERAAGRRRCRKDDHHV